jgi:GNAT superfamily N-acetyltransferase
MTVIAPESFMAALPELMPLFRLHWHDLALHKDKMPLAPRLAAYRALEDSGELLTLTARRDGRLIGYFIARIGPALHYETTLQGQTDLPYVHPDVRGRGIGVRLFLAAEAEMKRRGVKIWHASSKLDKPLHHSMDRVLRFMQFAPTGLEYTRWID